MINCLYLHDSYITKFDFMKYAFAKLVLAWFSPALWPLKKKTKNRFSRPFIAGQKYCRMLQESILQHFQISLSYHLSFCPLFCLFLSGHLRQVLLLITVNASDFIIGHNVNQLEKCMILLFFQCKT